MTDLDARGEARSELRAALERLDSDSFVADPLRLTRPPLRSGTVDRPGLIERMRPAADQSLLLVVAPSGSGKTIALRQWTETDARRSIWLSLDDLDNDPVYFLRHLVLALDQLDRLPDDVFEPLMRASPPVTSVVMPRLGRAMQVRVEPVIVVLDDTHLVRSPETLRCIQGLSSYLPEGSTLVLSGRTAPELALSRLRIEGSIVEVGPRDLAMTAEDAAHLFSANGLDLTPTHLGELLVKTEGWPAGLALAALASQGEDPSGASGIGFDGDHRLVAEYVRAEVLTSVPHDVVEFLLQSSVLPRMSGELCDEVLDTTGSGRRLERLATSDNLFVIALDDTRRWYRFHHLFAQALRSELHANDPALECVLHRRASEVHERNGNIDAAIRHARDAGDVERAAELIQSNAMIYGGRGRNATVGLWLELFDLATTERHANLALARAWYAMGLGDTDTMEHWADIAETAAADLAPDRRSKIEIAIAVYRAVVCVDGVGHMVKYTRVVREVGPHGNQWWGMATTLEGIAAMMMGEVDRGAFLLHEAEPTTGHMPSVQATCLAQLAFIALRSGDIRTATHQIDRALALVKSNRIEDYPLIVPVFGISALVRATAGDHEGARRLARSTRRLMAPLGLVAPRALLQACIALAQVDLLLGDVAGARTLAEEAAFAATREPDAHLMHDELERIRDEIARADSRGPTLPIGPSSLTTAELRVLELMPTHLSLGEIAEQRFVSRNTVKSHSIAIYRKLGVSSRSAAVASARELGLIEA